VKIFLDTNVLVSAFATRGLSADLFDLVLIEHEFITGRAVLGELEKALRVKIKLPAARRAEILEFVAGEAEFIVEDAPEADCDADSDDRRVLGEAIAGQADVFVTGDAAVTELRKLGGMRVLTPRQLWEVLRSR
jgi:putative PIN family toxin of toxin-antitoxin system